MISPVGHSFSIHEDSFNFFVVAYSICAIYNKLNKGYIYRQQGVCAFVTFLGPSKSSSIWEANI